MIAATVNGRPVITRVLVRHLAAAWRQHAQQDGISDRDVQLSAEPVLLSCGCTGWYARFYVPRCAVAVVVEYAQPHNSAQAARSWLAWMLQELHNRRSITLWPREGDA